MSSIETILLPLLYVAGGYLLRHFGLFQSSTPAPTTSPTAPAVPATASPSLLSSVTSGVQTLEQEAMAAIQSQLAGVARDALAKALSGLQVPTTTPAVTAPAASPAPTTATGK